jgi:DNA-binding LacI/PurR family transcriptional regulator
MRTRVTIDEVASRCGLSVATVSNALSGAGRMREETRERVRAVVQAMGYSASPAARGLRLRRSWSMGLVIPDIANPMYGEIARGASEVFEAAGCQLMSASHDAQLAKQTRLVRGFVEQGLGGVILQPWSSEDKEVVQLIEAGIPTVLLARRHYSCKTDHVGIDNDASVRKALAHLAGLNHRKIAITLVGGRRSSSTDERLAAYQSFMKQKFGSVDERMVIRVVRTDLDMGIDITGDLVASGATAVIASNDVLALGIRQGLMLRGLEAPRDMSLLAIDDTYLSSLPGIEMTSLSLPKRRIGEIAARLILERIEDPQKPVEDVELATELIQRKSTAAPGGAPVPAPN